MISTRLSIEDGQYWVTDGNPDADLALPDPGGDNGLVGVAAGLAIVVAGTQFGNVGLIVATGDSDPGLNLGGWDADRGRDRHLPDRVHARRARSAVSLGAGHAASWSWASEAGEVRVRSK
jgi:hypothetical protein